MAKALGIGGIFFKSSDPQKLSEWYARWLGVPVEAQPGMSFAIFLPKSIPDGGYSVWSAFPSDTTYFSPSNNQFMFNLMVDDLAQALSQVESGGAKRVGDIEKSEYGQFGWFIDPDGNKVELWQPPDEAG